MHNLVGEDGETSENKGPPPACAKQYDLRVLKHQAGPQGINQRNQRELTTLCVLMDHLVKGRNLEAADVIAGRIKAVEKANQDGHFHSAQYLELIPVKVEGLTTAEDKQILRHESHLDKSEWNTYGNTWNGSGKGSGQFGWVPNGHGEPKGKKGGPKGEPKGKKGGPKAKKGDGKG